MTICYIKAWKHKRDDVPISFRTPWNRIEDYERVTVNGFLHGFVSGREEDALAIVTIPTYAAHMIAVALGSVQADVPKTLTPPEGFKIKATDLVGEAIAAGERILKADEG